MASCVGTFDCLICYEAYTSLTRRPCIGQCGHSICEVCKNTLPTAKCPHCNREESFAVTTINYQVLEALKNEPGSSKKKNETAENCCSKRETVCKNLRICTTCGIMSKLLTRDPHSKITLYLENTTFDEAIEKAKKSAVCAECALDYHEKHAFMKLADLVDDSMAKSKMQERLNDTIKCTEKLLEDWGNASKDCSVAMHNLLNFSNTHSFTPVARKNHLLNVEISLETIDNINENFSDNLKKLKMTTDDINRQIHHMQQTGEVLLKKGWYLANSDPILIAHIKPNPNDPLLVGSFDPEQKKWTAIGRMPTNKSNYACASNRDCIYIVGGAHQQTWLAKVEMYNRKTNLLKDCPPLKRGRTRCSAQFHNGKLIVCGGYNGKYMDSVEIYDPESKQLQDGPKLNKCRADCSLVVFCGELYVLGGYDGKDYVEQIEKLSKDGSAFEIVGEMGGGRAGFGACVFKDRIFIAGGWRNSNNTQKDVRSFDPLTRKWKDEISMNKERKYFTLHPTKDSIFAIRGCADNWYLIPEVERFDVKTEKWNIIPCVAQLVNNSGVDDI